MNSNIVINAIRIQKVIRGFLVRKKLLVTNKRYSEIHSRNIMNFFYKCTDLSEFPLILQDYFIRKNALNQLNHSIEKLNKACDENDLNKLNNVNNSIKEIEYIQKTYLFLNNKPICLPYELTFVTFTLKCFIKPINLGEFYYQVKVSNIRKTEKEREKNIKNIYKSENGIKLNDEKRKEDGNRIEYNNDITFETSKNTQFIIEELLIKPICVICVIGQKKYPFIKILNNKNMQRNIKNSATPDNQIEIKDNQETMMLQPNINKISAETLKKTSEVKNNSITNYKNQSNYEEKQQNNHMVEKKNTLQRNNRYKDDGININHLKLPIISSGFTSREHYSSYRDYGFLCDKANKKIEKNCNSERNLIKNSKKIILMILNGLTSNLWKFLM